jgi:hypothetical protein
MNNQKLSDVSRNLGFIQGVLSMIHAPESTTADALANAFEKTEQIREFILDNYKKEDL